MSLRVTKPEFNIREKINELDRPIGVQGNNILQSNTTAESFSKIQAGRRNLLINGNMSIAQRGTSTTSITTDTFGACDRWELDINTAGTWTMEQVGDAPYNTGFTHCTSLTCTASHALGSTGNFVALRQKIEACNIKGLNGGTPSAKPLSLSFWVRSNEPGKYYISLYRQRSGTNTSLMSISYTIEQSEVWEFKTMTFPPDTMNGYMTDENSTGLEIHFALGYSQNGYGSAHYGHWSTNSAYLGKGQTNLAAATSNWWRMTGAQLEIGNEHTEFDHRSYQEEISLCQRYFTVFPPRSGGIPGWVMYAGSSQASAHVWIPHTMRGTPTPTDAGTGTSTTTGHAYNHHGGSVSSNYANGSSPTLSCGGQNGHYGLNMHFGSHQSNTHEADVASWNGTSPGIFLDAEL